MIDEVGNIIQDSGAVVPKACQNCKREFASNVEVIQKKGPAPIYACESCNFRNASGDSAFEHKLTTDHKIKKTTTERLVSVDKVIKGIIPYVTKEQDNTVILCGECNAKHLNKK